MNYYFSMIQWTLKMSKTVFTGYSVDCRINCSIFLSRVELVNRHTDTFHFNPYLVSFRDDRETATLYPYSSEKVVVIFVYGIDSKRQTNIWMTPGSRHTIIQMIGIFICLAAVVLFSIRKTFKLPRDSVISTFIDTMVAFISGGNLRMQHKYERWFFGILLIAAFFIMSLFTGDLLDCVILVLNQKFTKLQQLAELSSPIYVNSALAANVHLIREVLKLVSKRNCVCFIH